MHTRARSSKSPAAQSISAETAPKLVPLAALCPDPRNARRRTERSASLLARSLEQFGAARSVVIDEAGTVLAGNGTLEAAAEIGIEQVLVVPADGNTLVAVQRTDFNDTQKVQYAIADNRASDLSEWDARALADHIDGNPDLSLDPFFTDEELDQLMQDQGLTGGDEEPPEPQGKGSLTLKLEFESEDQHDRFCGSLQQLADAMRKQPTTERRLQKLMDDFLASQKG